MTQHSPPHRAPTPLLLPTMRHLLMSRLLHPLHLVLEESSSSRSSSGRSRSSRASVNTDADGQGSTTSCRPPPPRLLRQTRLPYQSSGDRRPSIQGRGGQKKSVCSCSARTRACAHRGGLIRARWVRRRPSPENGHPRPAGAEGGRHGTGAVRHVPAEFLGRRRAPDDAMLPRLPPPLHLRLAPGQPSLPPLPTRTAQRTTVASKAPTIRDVYIRVLIKNRI